MKTLQRLVESFNPELKPEIKQVTFNFQNIIKRKGYSLLLNDKYGFRSEVLTIEPKYYSNGDRWFVHGTLLYNNNIPSFYTKNISQVVKKITFKK